MSCNHCNVKFSFFHKEMGCSNCGLSFCHKCVKQKCKLPNKGPGDFPVCKKCHFKLSSGSNSMPASIPPPDAYLKRLESLENPAAPPITMYKHDKKLQGLRTGLSPADQQLIDRLEKLKDDKNKTPPTEDELRSRLASLKGENKYVEGPSKPLFAVDNRTDQQKVDSLLEQFTNEREIELSHNPERDIEARIATLREQGVRPNESAYISNLHDSSSSEEEMDRITKKIMDEVALEEKCPTVSKDCKSTSKSNSEEQSSSPELPWCVLCNKDARVRCLDCKDLYCSECNKEVHRNWGETDHTVIEYKLN